MSYPKKITFSRMHGKIWNINCNTLTISLFRNDNIRSNNDKPSRGGYWKKASSPHHTH